MRLCPRKIGVQCVYPFLEIGVVRFWHSRDVAFRILLLQHSQQARASVSELQKTQASISGTDHDEAEWRRNCCVCNLDSTAALAVFIRCHAKLRAGFFIDTA